MIPKVIKSRRFIRHFNPLSGVLLNVVSLIVCCVFLIFWCHFAKTLLTILLEYQIYLFLRIDQKKNCFWRTRYFQISDIQKCDRRSSTFTFFKFTGVFAFFEQVIKTSRRVSQCLLCYFFQELTETSSMFLAMQELGVIMLAAILSLHSICNGC